MKKFKVLIIGYGSAGRRHAKILAKNKLVSQIYIFTKQPCKKFKKINNLSKIKEIKPDYVIICSRTSDHYKHLSYTLRCLKNKKILVEKPLFNRSRSIKEKSGNKIIVGYNLRLHPVIQYVKKYIKNKSFFSVGIYCHSYLPNWRKSINYKHSNTAKKKYGGGILLELSHEIDYLQLLFGKIKKIKSSNFGKISNLRINTEDYALLTGETKKTNFNIDLNYFSKNNQRLIIVNGNDLTIRCDLINNTINILRKNKNKIIRFKNSENYSYKTQHNLILKNKSEQLCNLNEGLQILKIIDKIRTRKLNV